MRRILALLLSMALVGLTVATLTHRAVSAENSWSVAQNGNVIEIAYGTGGDYTGPAPKF